MIKAFRRAHMKYKLHLEDEKKKKQVSSDSDKQDIDQKVRQIGKAVTMMAEEALSARV